MLSQYTYTHDNNGNITGITDTSGTTNYIYDKLDRLIEIQRPNGKITQYTYDVRGNRSTVENDTWSVNLEATDLTFNELNQLTKFLTGNNGAMFQYSPTGLRTKKVNTTDTVRYLYNNDGKVIAESDDTNTLTANYVWGPDRLLVKKESSGNQYYYLYNGHGDVIQIVDTAGNVVNQYKYDEWGNIINQTEQIKNPFKYAGEIYDEETGLYYLRARYYDPSIGRFISKDSYEGDITNPLTLNQYAYVYNNPLAYIDPSGNIGIRQLDNLAVGIGASAWEAIKDIVKSPIALYEVGHSIYSGKISVTDIGNALGDEAIGPARYLIKNHKHVWSGEPTDAEVFEYGNRLGNILQLAVGGGIKGLGILSKASPRLAKAISESTNKSLDDLLEKVSYSNQHSKGARWEPKNLNEQLATKEVLSNPLNGATVVPTKNMNDPRWLGSEGWVKMQRIIETSKGKINIHFNYNTKTGKFDDFKFK